MLFRLFRQRGSLKKLGKALVRPLAHGGVAFIGSLIVWKLLIGVLHALGALATKPGLRVQYLVPLALGVIALSWRAWRDLGRASGVGEQR